MQRHKTSLSIFEKTKIISTILSNHTRIKKQYNQKKKKTRKTINLGSKQHATKQQMVP